MILHPSLVLILIYCRHKFITNRVNEPYGYYNTETNFSLYVIKYTSYQEESFK